MTSVALDLAQAAFRKRERMQRILASRLAAQKPVPATALLLGGVSELAIAGRIAHV